MIIIGEKINGAIPSVAKAISEKNEDWIRDLAKRQADGGANYIDVCSSVVDADVETLRWLIDLVQSVTDVPICIDSPSVHTIVKAMPFCKRPGLINSVSLEGDKIDTVFPVIADTPWQVIALLCDNNKIPDTAEERIAIFEKIMEKAQAYNIAPSRLHIDPLVFSVGTKPEAFTGFAEVTKYIRERYDDIHITSGLSNISFGIPSRKTMNMAFLTLARYFGMDSAIMDPTSRDMLGAMYATEVLMEEDEYCMEYLEAYNDDKFGVQKKA